MNTETKNYDHLDVGLTLQRLEPGVAPVPVEMSLASLAISMHRIANAMTKIEGSLSTNHGMAAKLDDIRYAINNVSNNGNSATSAANNANAHLANIGNIMGGILQHVQFKGNTPR